MTATPTSMTLSRRRLLQAAGLLAGGAALQRVPALRPGSAGAAPRPQLLNPRTLTPFIDPLPIPPVLTAADLDGGTLHAAAGEARFHSQLGATRTWGYTPSATGPAGYLGPTIAARPGEQLHLTVRNRIAGGHLLGVDTQLHGALPEDLDNPRIAVHLHGGYVPPESDGGPEDTFTPGEEWSFAYPNDQGAATLWYHDHAIGITRLNAYAGLAGLYVIDDGATADVLPSGAFDIPLVLQDKTFEGRRGDRTGNPLSYPNPWAAEFFGSTPVVNGAIWPTVACDRGFYRFRLLNGSSARFYHLQPSNPKRVPMWVVATESGLLATPQPVGSVIVSPGERLEIVLDLRNAPGTVTLNDLPLPPDVVSPAPGPFGPMVQLSVSRRAGGGVFDPAAERSDPPDLAGLRAAALPEPRRVSLVEHVDPVTGIPIMSMLNNLHFSTEPEHWEQPSADSVEIWEILNLTADTHPIHLHLVHFLLLDREGFDVAAYLVDNPLGEMGHGPKPVSADSYLLPGTRRPARPFETGWKDTVQAHPGEVTRIVVPFSGEVHPSVPFGKAHRFTGDYVWHCHILDHEDHEMMLPYTVLP
jgi:spore coat protein A, manganese oxidase